MQQQQGKYNKNRLAALGVLILLLLLLLFLIWWWFIPHSSAPTGPQPTATAPAHDTVVLPPQQAPATDVQPKVDTPAPGETEVRSLARNFTERYGSWSTDSKFQNLKDLFPNITSRLQASFQKTIDTSSAPTDFKSAETRVVQIQIDSLTATKASVLVTAQQTTRDAALKETQAFVKLALTMVNDGKYWYVDSAEWK